MTHASDYFDQLYDFAELLIRENKAYVCSLSGDEIRKTRGSLTEAGIDSPHRGRSIEENLSLFRAMKQGEFIDGTHVLRLKIDMSSPNINLRDPVVYRVRHQRHQRTGDSWCIYPMYDYTHCICDALEKISHSLCTLEFEDHRPLYDWVIKNVGLDYHPPQIEFSRLGLEFTVMSKRLLSRLVSEHVVDGWDDPRMPTIAGLRRRGVPASAVRDFCSRVGVTKQTNLIEMNLFEFCIRKELESSSPRGMCVLDPLEILVTNWDQDEMVLQAPWHPKIPALGSREMVFDARLFIEKDDFSEEPPPKWKRLSPGGLVRLRYGFIIRCDEVVYDDSGTVERLNCSYFPDSKSGQDSSGLKPKGVIHWVSCSSAQRVKVRKYKKLFKVASPGGDDFTRDIDPESLTEYASLIEPAIIEATQTGFQFERLGYFCKDSGLDNVFNETVSLRDGS